jgi:hypothetical protein
MNYFDNSKHLIGHCKLTLDKIKAAYNESLHDKIIKSSLLIEIKNFMENLRSALDYTAHGLYDRYGDKAKNTDKIYFPYAWVGLDKRSFQAKKIIEQKIPGLTINRPDIAILIENYQYFANSDNSWLPKFMDLNNENKHQQLTYQTRKEVKELKITSGNVGISLKGNAGIKLTGNAYIKFGNAVITGNQNITPENPAQIMGDAKQEIITWISFHFSANNEPVLPLLIQALNGTEKIVTELSSL